MMLSGGRSRAATVRRAASTAAAARKRQSLPRGVNVRQLAQPIQRSQGVVGLQAHDALQPQLCLRAEEAPAVRAVHFGPLFGEAVCELEGNLHVVGVAQHVVVKDDTAHAGQLHAACLDGGRAIGEEDLIRRPGHG